MPEQTLLNEEHYLTNHSFLGLNYTTINYSHHSSSNGRPNEDKTIRNIITICCYSLIVLVSLCGNLLVCKVAFGKRKMRTTTNMLIASLACSDLVMTVANIPFNVARLLLLDWPFGSILCFLVPFIQISCVYVSTFTMTVIAVHRWWTVSKSHNSRHFSCFRLIIVIAIIWLLAMTLSLPHSVFNHIKQVNLYGKIFNRCRATYPEVNNIRLFLTCEVFLTQYLAPLLITLVVYVQIGRIVSRQGRVLAISSDIRRRQQSEAKRRRILMLALVVIVFAVCWLPINVYYLMVDFKLVKHNFTLFLFVHWFAMSSVCYNPFIYCWLNESFRKGAKKFFLLFVKCRKPKQSQTPEVETHEAQGKLHTSVTAVDNNGQRVSL